MNRVQLAALAHLDALQRGAALEHVFAERFQRIGEDDGLDPLAILERLVGDGCHQILVRTAEHGCGHDHIALRSGGVNAAGHRSRTAIGVHHIAQTIDDDRAGRSDNFLSLRERHVDANPIRVHDGRRRRNVGSGAIGGSFSLAFGKRVGSPFFNGLFIGRRLVLRRIGSKRLVLVHLLVLLGLLFRGGLAGRIALRCRHVGSPFIGERIERRAVNQRTGGQ